MHEKCILMGTGVRRTPKALMPRPCMRIGIYKKSNDCKLDGMYYNGKNRACRVWRHR